MDWTSLALGALIGGAGVMFSGFLKKAGEDFYVFVRKSFNPKYGASNPPQVVLHVSKDELTTKGQEDTAGGAVKGEIISVSNLSYMDIVDEIRKVPPLQRSSIRQHYVGITIEWVAKYVGVSDVGDGMVRIQLSPEKSDPSMGSVFCTVKLEDYRLLNVVHYGAMVRVFGSIEEIGDHGITLSNSRLDFLQSM